MTTALCLNEVTNLPFSDRIYYAILELIVRRRARAGVRCGVKTSLRSFFRVISGSPRWGVLMIELSRSGGGLRLDHVAATDGAGLGAA